MLEEEAGVEAEADASLRDEGAVDMPSRLKLVLQLRSDLVLGLGSPGRVFVGCVRVGEVSGI